MTLSGRCACVEPQRIVETRTVSMASAFSTWRARASPRIWNARCSGAGRPRTRDTLHRVPRCRTHVPGGVKGFPQFASLAREWFGKAARLGNAAGQYALGNMDARGEGGGVDLVQAHMWLTLASWRFEPTDSAWGDKAIDYRRWVAADMTPAQIEKAQRLARKIGRQLRMRGHPPQRRG